jgi:FtsH-binding integral membrane protein
MVNYKSKYGAEEETKMFFQKVYGWMFFALIISASAAYLVANSETLISLIFGYRLIFYGLLILELVFVIALSGWIKRMSAATATLLFLLYSVTTGLTLSVIFLIYTSASIALVFAITAGMFGIMSIYGFVTKKDLTTLGQILVMALIGIILASVVNLFLNNGALDFIVSIIGVVIFTGLTAYDVQKIKNHNILGNHGTDEDKKEAIIGALALYLDLINMFLSLLRLFGKKR